MIIEFERAFSPESMELQPCGICGVEFQSESVLAQVRTGPGGGDMGCACRVCVEYLGDRNPEQFQSIEEYEQALQRYPQPPLSW